MKIITVLGARPQFIKAAPVSSAMLEAGVNEVLIHTGQHYDDNMSSVFFSELGIPEPDYNLNIGSATHGKQTGRMLEAIEEVLLKNMPDCVLVYGDTNSTLAGALAASKIHIPVAHIEAGLRSFNLRMPEEQNRILTDHLSSFLFVPTNSARENLLHEGISNKKIYSTGDVMFDAALYFSQRADEVSTILQKLSLVSREYCLATIHRAENTDNPARLSVILDALVSVAGKCKVVLPMHPRTQRIVGDDKLNMLTTAGINIIPPLGYLDMIVLEREAAVIATDSGGVQKEAFFYKVPCVTLRDETEWVESVELGWNKVVKPEDADHVSQEIQNAISTEGIHGNPYGEGDAAFKIIKCLQETLR